MARFTRSLFLLFLLTLVACGSGELQVSDVWVRPVSAGMQNSAFYMTVDNGTGEDDALLEVRSESCRTTELHESRLTGEDVMQMAPVPDGRIVIPAGETVILEPGGLHAMCVDAAALEASEEVPITLVFERAGELAVTAEVAGEAP